MSTVFEVESVFRIVNRASPAITAILRQVRELNAAIDAVRKNMAELGKGASVPAGLTAAIGETKALAAEWANVAKNAGNARVAMGVASTAAVRSAVPAIGGGGGRHQPPWLRSHFTGPGAPIPGGGHVRFGGGAAAAAGLLGYGAYEAAEMQDAVFQLIYHSGQEQNDVNRTKFRKVIQDAMAESGFNLKDITEAAKQEVRMFQGTPGGGLDVLPEMLRASWIEARLKGTSPEESMSALIGLAHMTKQYDPAAIKKLVGPFAFLSTTDPRSLSSIERAAGYSVPLLQSGLEIDPLQTLVASTALARAGITSTKSGTWLREMVTRAMPGSALQSNKAYEKHEGALYKFGLVDDRGRPTWFTGGHPDIMKLLEKIGEAAPKIPLTERTGYELQLFGKQGAGAVSTLTDPAVLQQVHALRAQMESSEFKNRYAGFTQAYQHGSTVQAARTAIAEFNVTLMDISAKVLPAVNVGLQGLKSVLEGIHNVLPNVNGAKVAGAAMLGAGGGALTGAAIGAFGGPIGAGAGAIIGGAAGAAYGLTPTAKQASDAMTDSLSKFFPKKEDKPSVGFHLPPDGLFMPMNFLQGPPGANKPTTLALSLNVDGQTLAQAVSEQLALLYGYPTGAPASNDAARWSGGGDHSDDI